MANTQHYQENSSLNHIQALVRAWKASNSSDEASVFWQELIENQSDKLGCIPNNTLGSLYEETLGNTKSLGIYYTPFNISQSLTKKTLGQYLHKQLHTINLLLQQKNTSEAIQHVESVKRIKVCDPACGCGIFLYQALHCFYSFYKALPEALAHLKPSANDIVSNQLFGVDQDSTAVSLASLSLANEASRLDDTDKNMTMVPLPIVCGDAFERAPQRFTWQKAFPQVKQWDFILGNPPYITEVRGHAEEFRSLKTESRISQFYGAKMDLCDAFVYLGLELLATDGYLAYVMPEYWLHRNSAQKLRKHVWKTTTIQEICTFDDNKPFKSAPGHHSSTIILKKTQQPAYSIRRPCLMNDRPSTILFEPNSNKFILSSPETTALLERLLQKPALLKTHQIQQGIVFPQSQLRPHGWKRLPIDIQEGTSPGHGIYVLTHQELTQLNLTQDEKTLIKPTYQPAAFKAYTGFKHLKPSEQLFLIYIDRQNRQSLETHPELFPNITRHLMKFRHINTSSNKPYGLHRPRQAHWFESQSKLFCRRQTLKPAFSLVKEPIYVGEGFNIICADNTNESFDAYAVLLNSSLAHFWFYHQKHKGKQLQVDKDVLLSFPQPIVPKKQWQKSMTPIGKALKQSPHDSHLLQKANELVYEAYSFSNQDIVNLENSLATCLGLA